MKKITLKPVPEKNIEKGIRIITGDTSYSETDIIAGQAEYTLPNQEIMAVYAMQPVEIEEEEVII